MNTYDMMMHLQELVGTPFRIKRYEISKELFKCKMVEGISVTTHVLKMIGYIEKLIQLDFVMDHGLNVDMILQSPLNAYSCHVSISLDQTEKHVIRTIEYARGC